MIPEKMQELIILYLIKNEFNDADELSDFKKFMKDEIDINSLNKRFMELFMEFLTSYAIDKQEKS